MIRATCVKFVDGFGTHLICPRKACQRDRACADRDMRDLPFCWKHYRGMLRFMLCVAAKRHELSDKRRGGEDSEPAMPKPFRGKPLLAILAEDGAPIQELARSAADGPDDFDWEGMPLYWELFRRFTRTDDVEPAAGAA